MMGSHLIKAWSRTQNNVTISSAEAELYAMVKCTAELIGIKSMMADWGRTKTGTLYADSTAALGIAKRKGAGKMRHININTLWIQGVQDSDNVEFQKVLGTENPADLMTKYLTRDTINKHMLTMGQEIREGRAEKGLEMQGTHGAYAGGDTVQVHVASVSKSRPAAHGQFSRPDDHTRRESHACVYSLSGEVESRGKTNMRQDSRQQGAASAAPRARVSCSAVGSGRAQMILQSGIVYHILR